MFWPLMGEIGLAFFGFALFTGGWMDGNKEGSILPRCDCRARSRASRCCCPDWRGNHSASGDRKLPCLTSACSLRGACSPEGASKCCYRKWRASALMSLYLAECSATEASVETFDKIARPNQLRPQVQQQTGSSIVA